MTKFKPHYKAKNSIMSNRKLFVVGLLAFALTLTASVTSTYAWFALSDAGKVSFTKLVIGEDHSLQIGLKEEDGNISYYDSVNDSILQSHFLNYVAGSPLADTSSMYQDEWLNENTDYETAFPVLRSAYRVNGDHHKSEIADNGFYQFEFFFKADSDMYLFLDYTGTVCSPLHELNQKLADSSNGSVSVKELDNVVNATRVSFFSKDGFIIFEPNQLSSSRTVFGGALDATVKDGYYDYDSRTGKEIVYGEYDDESTLVYEPSKDTDSTLEGRATCFNAKHKAGIQSFNYEKSVENGLSFKQETTYTLNQLAINQSQGQFDEETMKPIAKLKQNAPTRVVVTIYLEGWDLDVTEAIGNGSFTLALAFRGLVAPLDD